MQSFRFIEPILETQIVEQKFFANRISPSFLIREGKKKETFVRFPWTIPIIAKKIFV